MVQPYTLIDPAPAPTLLRYGLLSAAQLPNSSERWRAGVQRVGQPCGPALSHVAQPCPPGPVTGGPSHEGPVSWAGTPFWVYAWVECSPVGWGNDLAELRDRATLALTNGEPRAVERVFWTGETADAGDGTVYPHLQADTPVASDPQGAHQVLLQAAADEATGSAESPVNTLAAVEGRLASCYGAEGVVHMPRWAVPVLDAAGALHKEGQQLRTLNGNVVAAYSAAEAGGGPDGTGPAEGSAWFYGTPPVDIYRGPVQDFGEQPGQVLDRSDNTAIYVVGRWYVTWFDQCCLVAGEVDPGGALPA